MAKTWKFPGISVVLGPGVVTAMALAAAVVWVRSLTWELLYASGPGPTPPHATPAKKKKRAYEQLFPNLLFTGSFQPEKLGGIGIPRDSLLGTLTLGGWCEEPALGVHLDPRSSSKPSPAPSPHHLPISSQECQVHLSSRRAWVFSCSRVCFLADLGTS